MIQRQERGIRLDDLAKAVEGQVHGRGIPLITGVASLAAAGPQDLALIGNPRMVKVAERSQAGAFVVSAYIPHLPQPQLVTAHPQYALVSLIHQFFTTPRPITGIHPSVWKGDQVCIGPEASIGPFVSIGHRTTVGARVTMYPGVVLGEDVTIGDDCILYPHVTIGDRCTIGSRVIIHGGTVLGADGFGYVFHEGRHHKVPQLGRVILEDDVELGAHVTIDRATFDSTIVKRGTKIDNHVMIAHNVTIGEDCIITAQVGIAGSTHIGNMVVIGGQAGITDHVDIGDRVKIGAKAGVTKSIKAGRIVSGLPAGDHEQWREQQVALRRLPALRQQLADLETRLAALERDQVESKQQDVPGEG